MAVELRKDSPHPSAEDLAYPPRPDSRGIARKSWRNNSYNFGKHDTPESWLLFCEWRKHLIETGEAIRTADVREKLEASGVILSDSPTPSHPSNRRPSLAVYAAITIVLCIITGVVSFSVSSTADEFSASLTDEEKQTILGLRQHGTTTAAEVGNRDNRIAAVLAAMREKRNGTDADSGNGS